MTFLEEINNAGEQMADALKNNYCKIIRNTFILFLAFPIIKWCFWSIIYIIIKSQWVLNRLVETTFLDNVFPWYADLNKSLGMLILLFILVWIIYSIKESFER